MKTTQYTVRSVPRQLDRFLRHQAQLQGKSLNRTILDYMAQATKLDIQEADDAFDWIIGANTLDYSTLQAIAALKRADKQKSRL